MYIWGMLEVRKSYNQEVKHIKEPVSSNGQQLAMTNRKPILLDM
jgi:hypothetical protein